MNTSKSVEWPEVIAAEPQLADLMAEIKAIRDGGGASFCAKSPEVVRKVHAFYDFFTKAARATQVQRVAPGAARCSQRMPILPGTATAVFPAC